VRRIISTNGQRLTSAAAIIRQDRANYYRYGVRDPDDEGDQFFADEGNRAVLEQMLDRGRAEPGVLSRIVNGTSRIRVDIYRSGNGPFIRVTLLDQTRQLNAEQIGSYVARLSEGDHFNSSGQRAYFRSRYNKARSSKCSPVWQERPGRRERYLLCRRRESRSP
jgi:hypothetical protein